MIKTMRVTIEVEIQHDEYIRPGEIAADLRKHLDGIRDRNTMGLREPKPYRQHEVGWWAESATLIVPPQA